MEYVWHYGGEDGYHRATYNSYYGRWERCNNLFCVGFCCFRKNSEHVSINEYINGNKNNILIESNNLFVVIRDLRDFNKCNYEWIRIFDPNDINNGSFIKFNLNGIIDYK